MPVRNTESRIPNGFTLENAKKLGEAVLSSNYALISYLESPLRYGVKEDFVKHIKNTYVVFVNKSAVGVNDPTNYNWNVKFFEEDEVDHFFELQEDQESDDGAVFQLDTDDSDTYEELEGKNLSKLVVVVNVDGFNEPLILEQDVIGLNSDIESLIDSAGEGDEKGASAGDPELTRLMANYFRNLLIGLDKAKKESEPIDVSVHLVASVLYGALQDRSRFLKRIYEWLFGTDEEEWLEYINSGAGADIDDLIETKMGITDIKPHILHFYLHGPGDIVYNSKTEDLEEYEKKILDRFQQDTSLEEKIDLFNNIRFPKSCLDLTWKFLKKLKDRNDTWSGQIIDKESHLNNRDCITTIVSELGTAPQSDLEEPTDNAVKAYDIMYSKWIQTLLQTSYIQFETIKVKILDIRSGKPVKNAHVKKLLIASNDHLIINNFEANLGNHNWKKARGNTIGKQSQWSLWHLGYDPNGPSTNYGDTGRAKYKEYWDARVLDGSVEAIAEGKQPPEYMLTEIIEEYNQHRATDDNGILNIKVPTNLLEGRKVHIDVGFMHFPVICEELSDDERDNPIARSNNVFETTNFKIKWIGNDDENRQDLNWDKNVKGEAHFGWLVSDGENSSVLQVAQKLQIKTDYDVFNGFDSDLLSAVFDQDSNPVHFVLFGMQWCQPVWDEFDDPAEHKAGAINDFCYIQKDGEANKHMHLVTQYIMNLEEKDFIGSRYRGKGYGKGQNDPCPPSEPKWRTDGTHPGLDIHAKVGDKVFAVHGGTLNENPVGDDPGNRAELSWKKQKVGDRHRINYVHLNSFVGLDNMPVLAGTVVGIAGRSGILYPKSYQPGHVHLDVGIKDKENIHLREDPDLDNQTCIPYNDIPLMFPCACQITEILTLSGNEIKNKFLTEAGRQWLAENAKITCNFEVAEYVDTCWAVGELKCPYMHAKNRYNVMRLQSQLRYLNEKPTAAGLHFRKGNNPEYLHPGNINGDDGGIAPGGEVNLSAGDTIKADIGEESFEDGDYRRVKKGSIIGWALRTELGTSWNSSTKEYTLEHDLTRLLHGGRKKKEFSKTRLAIYNFREKAIKDDGSNFLKTGNENNWENYHVAANENDLLDKLNEPEMAPITLPKSS